MISVAIIGPDGAGKTTITRQLERYLPVPVKYVYMGVSKDSSNVMLPTSRLIHRIKRAAGARPDNAGPPAIIAIKPQPKSVVKRILAGIRASLRLVNLISEEWFRQGLVWYYQSRGNVVLFDRHFFIDYYAYDIAKTELPRPFNRRIHGFLLNHIYPRPDLVIYLDAPAEVLFARKGEGTVEALERRRQDYLHFRELVSHFAIVDATRTVDEVARQAAQLIWDFYQARSGKMVKVTDAQD